MASIFNRLIQRARFTAVNRLRGAQGSQLIQRGDLQSRIARGMGMQDRSPAPEFSRELQGVVLVDDLTRPNLGKDPTSRTSWVRLSPPPVGAALSIVSIAVPSDARLVLRVDQIIFAAGAALTLYVGFGTQEQVTQFLPAFADQRNGAQASYLAKYGSNAADLVALGLFSVQGSVNNPTLIVNDPGLVLAPLSADASVQDVLLIEGLTVNTGFTVSLKCTEIPL